jgi:ABC-type oligopeptide transport system substrate-binding subunit
LQQQWRRELNLEVSLVKQELKVFLDTVNGVYYNGVAEFGNWADYVDPNSMLDLFVTGSGLSGTGWSDPKYDAMLAAANVTIDPTVRMKKLAECELYLLKAMPFIPMFFSTFIHLQKPYVRGLDDNLLDQHPFKYAWIDTNWRPEGKREQISRK